jgi:hypothetical protein
MKLFRAPDGASHNHPRIFNFTIKNFTTLSEQARIFYK